VGDSGLLCGPTTHSAFCMEQLAFLVAQNFT